jgi:hypothetical protein
VSVPILNKRFDVIPEGAVYIGRPSPWGNPFTHLSSSLEGTYSVDTREEAVDKFRGYAQRRLAAEPEWLEALRYATALVCWCAPQSCHGQIIMELMGAA